jgi:aspartate/methionine/tyrosine aminotransferase
MTMNTDGDLTFVGKHTSIARHYPEGTIVLGGVSKWAGAGGWRMGAFTFPPELRWLLNAMASVASESYSCVSAPIQYGAIAAYTNTKEMHEYLENSRRVLNMVATFVVDRLRAGGAKVVPPEGGFYVLPDFSEVAKWASTGEEFCLKLLEEEGVAILPSHFFGRQKGEISARLAFVDFEGAGALTGVVGVARGQENNLKHATEFVTAYCPSIKLAMDKLVSFLHRRSHETR